MDSTTVSRTTEPNCVFCKIIDRKLPASIVSEDDESIAIRDVHPQAPTHILILPKNHVSSISEVGDSRLLGSLFYKAGSIARQEKLDGGFRLVVNTGQDGGQTVHHLHIHLLGGRFMRWPPG